MAFLAGRVSADLLQVRHRAVFLGVGCRPFVEHGLPIGTESAAEEQFLRLSMCIRGKLVRPVRNWTDSFMFLDDRRIKESAGRRSPSSSQLDRSKETARRVTCTY